VAAQHDFAWHPTPVDRGKRVEDVGKRWDVLARQPGRLGGCFFPRLIQWKVECACPSKVQSKAGAFPLTRSSWQLTAAFLWQGTGGMEGRMEGWMEGTSGCGCLVRYIQYE